MGLICCPDRCLAFLKTKADTYQLMFVCFIFVCYSFFYALFLSSTLFLPFFIIFTLLYHTSAFQLLNLSSFVYYFIFMIYAFSLCCFSLTSLHLVFYLHLSQLYSLYFYPFFYLGTDQYRINFFIFSYFLFSFFCFFNYTRKTSTSP